MNDENKFTLNFLYNCSPLLLILNAMLRVIIANILFIKTKNTQNIKIIILKIFCFQNFHNIIKKSMKIFNTCYIVNIN